MPQRTVARLWPGWSASDMDRAAELAARCHDLNDRVAHLETHVRLLSEFCRVLLKLMPDDHEIERAATEALWRFHAAKDAANEER